MASASPYHAQTLASIMKLEAGQRTVPVPCPIQRSPTRMAREPTRSRADFMLSRSAHGFFGAIDRREVIGAAAWTAVATATSRAAPATVSDLLGADTVSLWPGVPPGGDGVNP